MRPPLPPEIHRSRRVLYVVMELMVGLAITSVWVGR